MTACKHIESSTTEQSPLDRMLVTGYYDGPTEGFVECRKCGQTYFFRKLAWDRDQDVRIFGLAPLVQGFDQIRVSLKLGESDAAVHMVPAQDDEARSTLLDRLAMTPLSYVVAALDLRSGFLATRPLSEGDALDRDWFKWLGLSAHTRVP